MLIYVVHVTYLTYMAVAQWRQMPHFIQTRPTAVTY